MAGSGPSDRPAASAWCPLSEVGRILGDRRADKRVTSRPIMAQSARNRFSGIVTRIERDKVAAVVEVQCGPHRLVSLMTAEAVDDLGLADRRRGRLRGEGDERRRRGSGVMRFVTSLVLAALLVDGMCPRGVGLLGTGTRSAERSSSMPPHPCRMRSRRSRPPTRRRRVSRSSSRSTRRARCGRRSARERRPTFSPARTPRTRSSSSMTA